MNRFMWVAVLASTFASLTFAAPSGSGSALILKSQLADGWLAEYRSEPLPTATIMIEGRSHLLFSR